MPAFPDRAEIVIVGGGIVGCALAYHLARLGKRDVVLLEKDTLTSGSTWHAAGNIGQLRTSSALTKIVRSSVAQFRTLAAETGVDPDWREVGSLRVASSPERWLELRQAASLAKTFGLEVHLLAPSECRALYPLMSLDRVVGGAFTPSDGYVQPAGLTMAYAKGARDRGATILENARVCGLAVVGQRVRAVETSLGRIACETAVLAPGMWARPVGRFAGLEIPVGAFENQYLITEPIPGLPKDLPVIRDNDNFLYARPEVGGLLVGAVDKQNPVFGRGGVAWDFAHQLLPEDWERFAPALEPIAARLPVLNEVGVKSFVNGPLPMSADGEPIMGWAPGYANLFLACGFVAGIGQGGGAALAMAQWLAEGRPAFDLAKFHPARFPVCHRGEDYATEAAQDALARHYDIHYPGEQHPLDLGLNASPFHSRLEEAGAVFGTVFGITRPHWFAAPGEPRGERASYALPNWHHAVGREHKAVRAGAGIADASARGVFELSGPGALAFLQAQASADMDIAPGSLVRTFLLDAAGGILSDLTVARLAAESFLVLAGPAAAGSDFDRLARALPATGAALRDVSEAQASLLVIGPRSAAILAAAGGVAEGEWSLPPGGVADLAIGGRPVRALRHSEWGERAYDLLTPREGAVEVYDRLREADTASGLCDVGARALESLRIEAGSARYGHDLGADVTPLDAGLEALIGWKKADFVGKSALEAQRASGPSWRFVSLLLQESRPVFGGEAIWRDGRIAGVVTSAHFGFSVGRPVLLGFIEASAAAPGGAWQIEAFATLHAAERLAGAAYARPAP